MKFNTNKSHYERDESLSRKGVIGINELCDREYIILTACTQTELYVTSTKGHATHDWNAVDGC